MRRTGTGHLAPGLSASRAFSGPCNGPAVICDCATTAPREAADPASGVAGDADHSIVLSGEAAVAPSGAALACAEPTGTPAVASMAIQPTESMRILIGEAPFRRDRSAVHPNDIPRLPASRHGRCR